MSPFVSPVTSGVEDVVGTAGHTIDDGPRIYIFCRDDIFESPLKHHGYCHFCLIFLGGMKILGSKTVRAD